MACIRIFVEIERIEIPLVQLSGRARGFLFEEENCKGEKLGVGFGRELLWTETNDFHRDKSF